MTPQKNKDVFLLILSVFASVSSLEILKLQINQDVESLGGGFQEATATSQIQFMCRAQEVECIQEISKTFRLRKKHETLLILGNSQTGAINQIKDGDLTYAQIVASYLNPRELPTRSVWMPNATLKEFKILHQAISDCGAQPDYLVIPVFLDDTRESSVRSDITQLKAKICFDSITKVEEGFFSKDAITPVPRVKNSERLSIKIKNKLPIFSSLSSLNANFRGNLYLLRNTIFGINASSKRKILPSSYKENVSNLEAMINSRSAAGNKTFVYIPPLLYSESKPSMVPYIPEEYQAFKLKVKNLCEKPNCKFVDLESVVPDDEWGTKASTNLGPAKEELDFMHFTGRGHKRLAKALLNELKYFFHR